MKLTAKILRDAALRPTTIKLKGLKINYEFYPEGAVSKVILSGPRADIPTLFSVLDMLYPRDVNVSVRGNQWYDRNPNPVLNSYVATVAPHVSNERWTYTVPAGKKAFIEYVQLTVFRVTAAAPVGVAIGQLAYIREGGSSQLWGFTVLATNNVGDSETIGLGHSGIMLQGDTISYTTSDNSTGGTIAFSGIMKITEFDA